MSSASTRPSPRSRAPNVPVFWVGLPPQRDARQSAAAVYLNELYRTRAERAGIIYVDIWDGFVDEAGRYVLQGPDFEGQIRRLRSGDGVYFTRAGARKLAHYVEREILRSLVARQTPVALPAPEPAVLQPGRPRLDASARRPGGSADGLDRRRQRTARRRPDAAGPATIRWRPACWCAASRSPRRPGVPTISPGRAAASPRSAKASPRKCRRRRRRRRRSSSRRPPAGAAGAASGHAAARHSGTGTAAVAAVPSSSRSSRVPTLFEHQQQPQPQRSGCEAAAGTAAQGAPAARRATTSAPRPPLNVAR